jgi:hypothetical protein
MAKPNPLQSALEHKPAPVARPSAPTETATAKGGGKGLAPSRVGRVMVAGYFAPEVQTALRIIAAEERTTIQELVAEGLDLVLAKRKRPQIARLSPNGQG